jgi:hypothetical protein
LLGWPFGGCKVFRPPRERHRDETCPINRKPGIDEPKTFWFPEVFTVAKLAAQTIDWRNAQRPSLPRLF